MKLKKAINKIRLRKVSKSLRKRVGLTSDNKWIRGIKRRISTGAVASYQPTSAASYQYVHAPRTLSQMTGGM